MQLLRAAAALTDRREEPDADASHGRSLSWRGWLASKGSGREILGRGRAVRARDYGQLRESRLGTALYACGSCGLRAGQLDGAWRNAMNAGRAAGSWNKNPWPPS